MSTISTIFEEQKMHKGKTTLYKQIHYSTLLRAQFITAACQNNCYVEKAAEGVYAKFCLINTGVKCTANTACSCHLKNTRLSVVYVNLIQCCHETLHVVGCLQRTFRNPEPSTNPPAVDVLRG